MDQKTIAINMMVTGPFPSQIAARGAQMQTFGNQAHAGMAKAQTGMQKFGAAATKVATFGLLAVVAGLALSAKAAIDFESSFAGIRKTVDTSEAGFRMLAQGIRQMSTEIPIGVNELNRIGELGGQLGVKPGDLLEFIDVIAKIGVTTTLSTDQAAMGFARIDNIMQLGGGSFDNMGASIVDLGNNFAATEDEILTFALRVAPVGATVGLVTDEVLGIATAFTSVGIPAERGGTAIQKTFIKMAEAAKNGGVELDIFAETAGLTAEAFAAMFESDPAEAFTLFVEGLGRINEEGENVFAVLDAVGLGNERVRASLLAAANATGVLRAALDLSAKAWGDNTALTEEAQKRFETTASALIILKNKVQDIAITLGSALLPAINTFIDGSVAIVDFFANLEGGMQAAILAIPAFLAAMAVAAAHPAVAAILAVSAAVYRIGAEMGEAARESVVMQDAVRELREELKDDPGAGIMGKVIQDYFAAGGDIDVNLLRSNMAKMGLTMTDFADAVSGTDDEWTTFYDNFESKQIESGGITLPVVYLAQVRKAWKDANTFITNERRLQIEMGDLDEEEFWRRHRDRIRQNAGMGGGGTGPEFPEIRPAILDDKYMTNIDTMFDDYTSVFTEAFDETDKRIRSQIDLWYEFGDALEINFGELLPNLLRQVQAVGKFEEVLEGLGLSGNVEEFIRGSFNTGALKEAFLDFRSTSFSEFMAWIAEIEAIMGPTGPLMRTIFDAFSRDVPDLEFAAGAELLSAMAGIVEEIQNDPENLYSPAEVWLGVIQAALIRGGPELAPQFIETMKTIFGEGGIPGVDLTIQQITDLAIALGLLPRDTEVNVDYILTYSEIGRVPEPLLGYLPEPPKPKQQEKRAAGGSVFAGEPYLVGERGAELMIPFVNGTIIPNSKLDGLGGTTRHTTVNVIRPETNDLAGDISEGLTRASISEQVDLIGAY